MKASEPESAPNPTVAANEAPTEHRIRKGQHKPYVKGTRKQIELRLEAVALLDFCRLSKAEIHQVFRERYGIEWRQADRYMARARAHDPSK